MKASKDKSVGNGCFGGSMANSKKIVVHTRVVKPKTKEGKLKTILVRKSIKAKVMHKGTVGHSAVRKLLSKK